MLDMDVIKATLRSSSSGLLKMKLPSSVIISRLRKKIYEISIRVQFCKCIVLVIYPWLVCN